ncbi:hypothetical protein PCIT_a0704 [Pseudoalteromonas citrea]|uniref:CREG-like beta-barrel domain-containing protein n=2 Tax=Pseudoalteromonas citrea TaxID=43655 RepID=A0AAD4ALD6_9GAMM|nr:pyridoxamine 5'-phosphate oxidase family protein [Pseudoalteromonas citrea]KAF7774284.1 hypothetical protein PCIT_a0704 [Pseudoalteromonas citrea]
MRDQALIEAKNQLHSSSVAVLSTHSQTLVGYPFGSTVQFVCNDDNNVYLFISDIAQHAKNLTANSALSLTVFNQTSDDDPQTARLTLVGDATKLTKIQSAPYLNAFVEKYPTAQEYMTLKDFNMWRISIVRARFIAGFGKIFWLEKNEWYTQTQLAQFDSTAD